jgi:bacillithiol biosynthesis deacetylase BshB1
MKLDILVVAPHPDDAEVWCGGYIAKAVADGYKVGVLDLTKGELSSNGTLTTRAKETALASKILGLSFRSNAKLPDGAISSTNPTHVKAVVKAIRELKPKLVIAPYHTDRHPDHEESSRLVQRAVFSAGLLKYSPRLSTPHTISSLCFYQMRTGFAPSFLVDVSAVYETKLKSIRAYKSQLNTLTSAKTLIADPRTLQVLQARDTYFGSQIGVQYAEAYFTYQAVGLSDPLKALSTPGKVHFFNQGT